MHRRVALKVLDTSVGASRDESARFEREAWIGGRLSHPHVVKVHAQGVHETTHFIAMELVEGQSLHGELQRLREARAGQLKSPSISGAALRRMVSLFVGVADALEHVHANGIVHRDIKPPNLLLTPDGTRLLLSDFGLARDDDASRLTRRGDFMGTIRYMSPEQLLAHRVKVDHRCDIWSLGVSLYEAVTLELPYEAGGAEGYISAVATKEPLAARFRNRAVPRDLETILMKCLERDPERRYASAGALRDDLQRFLEDRPVLASRAGPIRRAARFLKRHRTLAAGSAIAAAIAAGALVLFSRSQREREDLERIRTTLEQFIARGVDPQSVQPDWKRLRAKLDAHLEKSPRGSLAILAERYACDASVVAPASFGLLSEPPDLELRFFGKSREPVGRYFLCIVDVEFAWDGAAWQPIASCVSGHDRSNKQVAGHIVAIPLLKVLSAEVRGGPHRLELRAHVTLFDGAPVRRWSSSRTHLRKRFDESSPELRRLPVVSRETRSLGSYSINLFDGYPEDFPGKVPLVSVPDLSKWMKVSRVTLVRTQTRIEAGRCFSFDLPGWSGGRQCLGDDMSKSEGDLVGLSMEGMIDASASVGLAAIARVAGTDRDLLRFPLAIGAGYVWIHAAQARPWIERHSSSEFFYRVESDAWTKRREDSLPTTLADGVHRGRLELTPSREAALQTRRLDRYLDAPLSLPIDVEVRTVTVRVEEPPKGIEHRPSGADGRS
jgi:serine/threonine protein kinase